MNEENWQEVNAWRRDMRRRLIARRRAMSAEVRSDAAARIAARIRGTGVLNDRRSVGFYWPIKAELDMRPLIRDLVQQGWTAALPVVVEKRRPVEFWAWAPGETLDRGFWNIPVPTERRVVRPHLLLVPLVGFDRNRFRLGYGGGYYDRTLAAAQARPVAVGLGLDEACLDTIRPQPHDIAMDLIVTERRVLGGVPDGSAEAGRTATYASPPCFMHDLGWDDGENGDL